MKRLVVIDGQGGGFGKSLIEALRRMEVADPIIAVGLNSLATSAMLKAGADAAATGQNAAVVNAAQADILVGPLGLIIANSMLGECTPAVAFAIAKSPAIRILIPSGKCSTQIAGLGDLSLQELIQDAARRVRIALKQ